jgi:hypothetical protein
VHAVLSKNPKDKNNSQIKGSALKGDFIFDNKKKSGYIFRVIEELI